MKTDDIILVSSSVTNYQDLLPRRTYIYAKIIKDGTIISFSGDVKRILKLKLKPSHFLKKSLNSIKNDLFNDYIYNLTQLVIEESCAYQFTFQHKDNLTLYTCSIYPCFISTKCTSVDMVIRKKNEYVRKRFFGLLKNTAEI